MITPKDHEHVMELDEESGIYYCVICDHTAPEDENGDTAAAWTEDDDQFWSAIENSGKE